MHAEQQRRASRRVLEQRRAEMPIIDRARWAGRPGRVSLWLRVLRPLLVTVVWLVAVRYAWNHFFGLADELPIWQQVALYGIAIAVILVAMLGLAPLRRREWNQERRHAPGDIDNPSTLTAVSEFSNLPVDELAELQLAQRLVVHHDEDGMLQRAEDTRKLLEGR
jgi:poly-beta-1,6-N-acetyl-D-glucosamine biosynthesis protein PgaD